MTMLQYLLNATAIWLASLITFDAFLRREAYHGYNRAYLLFTLVMGALLPLVHWQAAAHYTHPLAASVQGVRYATQEISRAAAPVMRAQQSVSWLWMIYITGAAVAAMLLIADAVKLAVLYRNGNKIKDGSYTIVQTGKSHTPFSFLHIIFVCSRSQYNDAEWRAILLHESRHRSLFHLADVLLLQLARIVFWFHPLVYIYNKRLLLIHEYQADQCAAGDLQEYCRFLIQQALLHAAPRITHSFNSSPIKNRIIMLTKQKQDRRFAKAKLLIAIPLTAVCIFCCTQNGYSDSKERNGNKVTYKGNVFELSGGPAMNVNLSPEMAAKTGGKVPSDKQKLPSPNGTVPAPQKFTAHMDSIPITMNGEKIYEESKVDKKAVYTDGTQALCSYIIQHLSLPMRQLPDGDYTLFVKDVVVDKSGKLAYYNSKGLINWREDPSAMFGSKQTIYNDPAILEAIDKTIDGISSYTPAIAGGAAVPCRLAMLLQGKSLVIKNHILNIADSKILDIDESK